MNTNKYDFEYDSEAINRDFIIIRITRGGKNKNWFGAGTLLQSVGEKYQALSVLYDYSSWAYLLFRRKDIPDPLLLRTDIAMHPRLQDEKVEILTSAQRNVHSSGMTLYGYWVVSLLINALPSLIAGSELPFPGALGTLNGKLYLWDAKANAGKLFVSAFEMRFGKDGVLSVRETSFKRIDQKSLVYIKNKDFFCSTAFWKVDKRAGVLSLFSGDPETALKNGEVLYMKGAIHSSKIHANRTPFFDVETMKSLDASRTGKIQKMERWITRYLNSWVTLTPVRLECKTIPLGKATEKLLSRTTRFLSLILDEPLSIIDTIKTEESARQASYIIEEWKNLFPSISLPCFRDSPSPRGANLMLLHDKVWYLAPENCAITDPHIKDARLLIQHFTLESFLANEKKRQEEELKARSSGRLPKAIKDPTLLVCMKELCIKYDLLQKKSMFFDWQRFNYPNEYTFANVHLHNRINPEKKLSLVNINSFGEITTEEHKTNHPLFLETRAENLYQQAFLIYKERKKAVDYKNYTLEGYVENHQGYINYIYRTEMVTMPAPEHMSQMRKELNTAFPEKLKNQAAMADWISSLFDSDSDLNRWGATIPPLVETVRAWPDPFDRKQLLQVFRSLKLVNQLERKRIQERLYAEYGIRLQQSRNKDNKAGLFQFKLNLHWTQISDNELMYAVGYPQDAILHLKFPRASHFRYVYAPPGHRLFFSDLFPAFDDNAIRADERTVLPIPFKYLREILPNEGEE